MRGKFLRGLSPRPLQNSWLKFFVTRMLTRDPFAVANFLAVITLLSVLTLLMTKAGYSFCKVKPSYILIPVLAKYFVRFITEQRQDVAVASVPAPRRQYRFSRSSTRLASRSNVSHILVTTKVGQELQPLLCTHPFPRPHSILVISFVVL